MSDYASLSYTFILKPSETFSHVSEFESFLGKVLAERGMEGQFLNTLNGSSGNRIILIKSKANEVPNITSQPGKPPKISTKSVQEQMKDLMPKPDTKQTIKADKFKKGRFLKTKGYLKKQ